MKYKCVLYIISMFFFYNSLNLFRANSKTRDLFDDFYQWRYFKKHLKFNYLIIAFEIRYTEYLTEKFIDELKIFRRFLRRFRSDLSQNIDTRWS